MNHAEEGDAPPAAALHAEYGHWGEHPEHRSADWRNEVVREDTRLGYWEWVAVQIAAAEGEGFS